MSVKKPNATLSKHLLEMKFMQRTKRKVDKQTEEAEGKAMYSNEITEKMLSGNCSILIQPSFVHLEKLIDGRLSFRGMNPELERLMELEEAEKTAAATRPEQPKEVTDEDMAKFYAQNTMARTIKKKFEKKSTKNKNNKRKLNATQNEREQPKFKKPKTDSDNETTE